MSQPQSSEHGFAELLWQRGASLTPEVIAERVVRKGSALGPIALGEQSAQVFERLSPENLPTNSRDQLLDRLDESAVRPGCASGTFGGCLTGYSVAHDELGDGPQCWLEWAVDAATDAIVQVSFCVAFNPSVHDDGGLIASRLRAAFDDVHGPGKERPKKHSKSSMRPIDWALEGAQLTLGNFYQWGSRYVVVELTAANWLEAEWMRLEVFE